MCLFVVDRCTLLGVRWRLYGGGKLASVFAGTARRVEQSRRGVGLGQEQEDVLLQVEAKTSIIVMCLSLIELDFSGNVYWRYDDVKEEMDPGYPRDISRWRGVPSHLDAAMRWIDGIHRLINFILNFYKKFFYYLNFFFFCNLLGKTYFFKRKSFWGFDDALVRTELQYPLAATGHWLGC